MTPPRRESDPGAMVGFVLAYSVAVVIGLVVLALYLFS